MLATESSSLVTFRNHYYNHFYCTLPYNKPQTSLSLMSSVAYNCLGFPRQSKLFLSVLVKHWTSQDPPWISYTHTARYILSGIPPRQSTIFVSYCWVPDLENQEW